MLKIATVFFLITLTTTYGHNNRFVQNLQNDANMQADLMPQELNTAYEGDAVEAQKYPARKSPRRPRTRRDVAVAAPAEVVVVTETPAPTGIAEQVKQYSRVVACFVLFVSAAIEVVVYFIEAYQV